MTSAKPTLRLLIAGAAAIGIAGPAIAQSCVPASERAAFDVRALQSQLMVAALTCNRDADYNAFVRKFQRDLAGSYNTIQGHFRRTAGGGHQRALDGFITQLANEQSQDGIRQGSQFCPNVTPLFQVALAQPNVASLAELTVDRNVLNPMSAPACPDRAATTVAARSSSTRAAPPRRATATRAATTTRSSAAASR
jgi:hypothetical protein